MSEQKKEQLSRIVIKGFKSIKDCDLELKNINVLIGSNGAGKSNFVSVFELLQSILTQNLQVYAAKKGATSLFHNGIESTESILMEFYPGKSDKFCFELGISENTNVFLYDKPSPVYNSRRISEEYQGGNDWISQQQWRVYHFHDTSSTAKLKREHNICNNETLLWDASNLAAYLYRLREYYSAEYKEILSAIQLIAPFFYDFVLKPSEHNSDHILLRWQQKGCEDIFYAPQLSDGTLRFICLATLLLQPEKLQPATIIVDEPELGLHPFAITIAAEMAQKAAVNKQVILATQSTELLDCFDAEEVVVVDCNENGSEFKRLDAEQLRLWLENEYTLGELWNKNIFGGRP